MNKALGQGGKVRPSTNRVQKKGLKSSVDIAKGVEGEVISKKAHSTSSGKRREPRRNVTGGAGAGDGQRTVVDHTYRDHYHDPTVANVSNGSRGATGGGCGTTMTGKKGPRGGVAVAFPERLHEMLLVVEEEGLGAIVSWMPHGRCFLVREKAVFVESIMPR